jgi:hypothetical protein
MKSKTRIAGQRAHLNHSYLRFFLKKYVVDASRSMGAEARMKAAKAIVLSLLNRSYQIISLAILLNLFVIILSFKS